MADFNALDSIQDLVKASTFYRKRLTIFLVLSLMVFAIHVLRVSFDLIDKPYIELFTIAEGVVATVLFIVCCFFISQLIRVKTIERGYDEIDSIVNAAMESTVISQYQQAVESVKKFQQESKVVLLIEHAKKQLFVLSQKIEKLTYRNKSAELTESRNTLISENRLRVQSAMAVHPLIILEGDVNDALKSIKSFRKKTQEAWDKQYEKFSWWNKLKYDEGPDFQEVDKKINQLDSISKEINRKYGGEIARVKINFDSLEKLGRKRISESYKQANTILLQNNELNLSSNQLLQRALWCSIFSVPVLMWSDFNSAGNIYDSLRSVNGNFAELSDSEIWWESLWMSSESLTGLASLTKGAYFEQLVANDTGGQLFEHFNHKDTDIVIDGVAVQLKATDSVSYIESVNNEIPVITTSEVAEKTGMIDSGYSNEELTKSINLALDGSVIDVGDTAVDALLAGAGGLGVFATIHGINHAKEQYDKGKDSEEAILEGLGLAIEGTAKGVVDILEFIYRLVVSRPMCFIGRILLKGLKKLGLTF